MRLIGIDAGSTSVCGVLLNAETAHVEQVVSQDHHAQLTPDSPDVHVQDPDLILSAVQKTVAQLRDIARHLGEGEDGAAAIAGMSLTGQVHGILYIDARGQAVSPLYTWQDGRGRSCLPGDGKTEQITWVDWTRRETGRTVPAGYGLLTHRINMEEGRVPRQTAGLTSLLGFLAMRIGGSSVPRLEPSDAQPLGLFLPEQSEFDTAAIGKLGIDVSMIPEVVQAGTQIGESTDGIPVFAAVGDNQAGYIGAVRDTPGSALINVGTSAQLSVYLPPSDRPLREQIRGDDSASEEGWVGELEVRPFPGGGSLLSGASLSGGSAYRLLESLFREICLKYTGSDPGDLLAVMNAIPYDTLQEDQKLQVETQFLGTRRKPGARGTVAGIGTSNLTHDYLVEGFLHGIVLELRRFWSQLPPRIRPTTANIIGVGNGIRRNPLLRRILAEEFGVPVVLPADSEEAALGAAIIAGVGVGAYESYTSGDRPIVYESA